MGSESFFPYDIFCPVFNQHILQRDNRWHVEHIIMQIEISGHYYDSVFFFDKKRVSKNEGGREGGAGKELIALGRELYVN